MRLTKETIIEPSVTDWDHISSYYELDEEFITKYWNKVNWYYISMDQKLSEDLIIQFQDKVCCQYIGAHQVLSEKFINRFSSKLDWKSISMYQALSEKFIIENKDKISFLCLLKNERLGKYSEKMQRLILKETFYYIVKYKSSYYESMTSYMKEQFEKLRIML